MFYQSTFFKVLIIRYINPYFFLRFINTFTQSVVLKIQTLVNECSLFRYTGLMRWHSYLWYRNIKLNVSYKVTLQWQTKH